MLEFDVCRHKRRRQNLRKKNRKVLRKVLKLVSPACSDSNPNSNFTDETQRLFSNLEPTRGGLCTQKKNLTHTCAIFLVLVVSLSQDI